MATCGGEERFSMRLLSDLRQVTATDAHLLPQAKAEAIVGIVRKLCNDLGEDDATALEAILNMSKGAVLISSKH
jgi:hypothetical protein